MYAGPRGPAVCTTFGRVGTEQPHKPAGCTGVDDDDVYYYIRWRLELEGETENTGVCTKERKGVTAAVLMATPGLRLRLEERRVNGYFLCFRGIQEPFSVSPPGPEASAAPAHQHLASWRRQRRHQNADEQVCGLDKYVFT